MEALSYTHRLLELINVFAARPHKKTFVFLSTEDSTNGGLVSSTSWPPASPDSRQKVLVVSFDKRRWAGGHRERPLSVGGVTSARNTTPGGR